MQIFLAKLDHSLSHIWRFQIFHSQLVDCLARQTNKSTSPGSSEIHFKLSSGSSVHVWGKRKVAGGRKKKKQLAYSILDTHTVLGHKLELIFIRSPPCMAGLESEKTVS